MNDRRLVDAELHFAGLDLLNRFRDVESHRAGLRIGHQPARTEDLSELSDGTHHVGSGDHRVEVDPAFLDLRHHVVAADHVGTRFLRFLLFFAGGDHQHALQLSGSVREHGRSTDHLIGVFWIDSKKHRQFDRLIELGVGDLLEESHRFIQLIGSPLDLLGRRTIFLAVLGHLFSSVVLAAVARLLPLFFLCSTFFFEHRATKNEEPIRLRSPWIEQFLPQF